MKATGVGSIWGAGFDRFRGCAGFIDSALMLQQIFDERFARAGVPLYLWRLDQLPGVLAGNKYYKLSSNLDHAVAAGRLRVASFGGAWSNHLHALARAGQARGLKTLGLVRADASTALTPMLEDARRWGMEFIFLSRSDYRRRHDPGFLISLSGDWPDTFWVPEGGSNALGVTGCVSLGREIARALPDRDLIVALACGTGGTLAGVAAGLGAKAQVQVCGYPMVKGGFYQSAVEEHLRSAGLCADNWAIVEDVAMGGYGTCSPELARFIVDFYRRHQVVLEPVYTGKLLYALLQQVQAGEFQGRSLLALHTGGLQGLRGYPALLADLAEVGFQGLEEGF